MKFDSKDFDSWFMRIRGPKRLQLKYSTGKSPEAFHGGVNYGFMLGIDGKVCALRRVCWVWNGVVSFNLIIIGGVGDLSFDYQVVGQDNT